MGDVVVADSTITSNAYKEEVPMDENDISLHLNPLILLLREQNALEALFTAMEDESLARLGLLRAYHRGLRAIVCRALEFVPRGIHNGTVQSTAWDGFIEVNE